MCTRYIYVCSNHYINNCNFIYLCDLDLLVKSTPSYDGVVFHLWTCHNYITLVQIRLIFISYTIMNKYIHYNMCQDCSFRTIVQTDYQCIYLQTYMIHFTMFSNKRSVGSFKFHLCSDTFTVHMQKANEITHKQLTLTKYYIDHALMNY